MTAGGIFPAIVGMVEMVILMTLAGVPIGVATAIYLHEYASPVSPLTRAIRIAVANLAGVPSIVFGLFGLGLLRAVPRAPASTRRSSTAKRSSVSRR